MQHDFILLDRSGSMQSQWVPALLAINGYVAGIAAENVDTGVTLATFDEANTWVGGIGPMSFTIGYGVNHGLQFEVVRDRIVPKTWKPIYPTEISPRGGTPLNDAVGRIVALAKAGNYDKLSLMIMTDGAENASKELSTAQAKALLDDCRARGWQVTFLGANYDNWMQAQSYGNAMQNTIASSTANLGQTMDLYASKRSLYGATGQSIGWTANEKAQLAR